MYVRALTQIISDAMNLRLSIEQDEQEPLYE